MARLGCLKQTISSCLKLTHFFSNQLISPSWQNYLKTKTANQTVGVAMFILRSMLVLYNVTGYIIRVDCPKTGLEQFRTFLKNS